MNRLNELDHQITIFLNQLGSESMDGFWLWVTEASSWYWMYGACIILFFILDKTWGFVALVTTVLTFALTDWVSVHLFKEVFERLRPCHQAGVMEYIRLVPEGCGGQFGFVSSHAANTFGLAVIFGRFFKPYVRWAPYFFALYAFLNAASRVYLGVHYFGDVLVGAILGIAIASITWWAYKYVSRYRPL